MKESLFKLCNPKSKMLLKEEQKKPVFRGDEKIRVNEKFESNNLRISFVPKRIVSEATGGVKETDGQVLKERGMVLDATCMRIMKSRKIVAHNDLVTEIIHQTSMFQAQPPFIKKRIESLIEREYLERDS